MLEIVTMTPWLNCVTNRSLPRKSVPAARLASAYRGLGSSHLTRQRIPANQWAPEINSDLTPDFPITNAEIDAILLLLGDDLKTILG